MNCSSFVSLCLILWLTLLRTYYDSCSFPRSCGLRYCKHFSVVLTKKEIRQKGFLFHFILVYTFVYVKACSYIEIQSV